MNYNDAYTRTLSRSVNQEVGQDYDDTNSEVNIGCRSSQKEPSAVGATTEHGSCHEYEDKLVQNVAYMYNKQSVISVFPNVAYSSHQQTTILEDDVLEYTYI